MPVKTCEEGGRPGFKYGDGGKCYIYDPHDEASVTEAKRKAHVQGYVIERSMKRAGKAEG